MDKVTPNMESRAIGEKTEKERKKSEQERTRASNMKTLASCLVPTGITHTHTLSKRRGESKHGDMNACVC